MRLKLIFLILLIFSSLAFSQVKLTGEVKDSETGEKLESVNIFLPELQLGTFTDKNGNYSIENLPNGSFSVQFSYVGYKSKILLVLLKGNELNLNVDLTPSKLEIGEVVVLGNNINELEKVPYKIEKVETADLKQDGMITLNRSLTLLPGISELSNGFSISKPVVRGLFGYRVAAIVSGLRFDNQEWQNEHGFGVNDVGIGSVEVIEGPAALLYGANVIGGAVNFVDPNFAPVGRTLADANLQIFSNTLGANADFGVKGSGEKIRWQLYAGGQSHADYLDGNDEKVPNTRFAGADAKGILSYNYDWGYSNLSYSFSHHLYGVVEEAELNNPTEKEEDHFEREFKGPHHTIQSHIASLRNLFFSGDSKFKLNLGFQNNHRIEEEGNAEQMTLRKITQEEGDAGELDVILNTFSYDAEWIYPVFSEGELTLGTQGQIQANENEGGRILVPNADMNEFSGFAYLKKNFQKFLFEGGARYDFKKIETTEMGTPGEEAYFAMIDKDYNTFNGAIGGSFFPDENWIIKINAASGFRAPNLAELASNGVHEGTTRYEIGDANLESEQNIQGDLGITFVSKIAKVTLSAFNNHVNNFIYLSPTGETIDSNDVYRFVQTDADLHGGEFSIDVKPVDWLDLSGSFSMVIGEKSDDSYLPFMPADKIVASVKFLLPDLSSINNNYFLLRVRSCLEQNRNAANETATPAYTLLDVGFGGTINFGSVPLAVTINGTNILNEVYVDHLSLLKPLGVNDMGRNISLALSVPFALN
jgi:iron complex outermembrane recepter protein